MIDVYDIEDKFLFTISENSTINRVQSSQVYVSRGTWPGIELFKPAQSIIIDHWRA